MITIDPCDRATLALGDCADVLAQLPMRSIDAMVTDPPAGVSFMGKAWDGDRGGRGQWVAWLAERMALALRAMKPGAHALVWALPRTSHWTATAIEDAGFEVRDVVTHLFGTGFPKSLDLGDGEGTALKPGKECWILARRPVEGTVSANRAAHGTGGLQIDACRIARAVGDRTEYGVDVDEPSARTRNVYNVGDRGAYEPSALGRWPANVVLSHGVDCADGACAPGCPVPMIDAMGGAAFTKTTYTQIMGGDSLIGTFKIRPRSRIEPAEIRGGASRFFYCAKPSRAEREIGLESLAPRTAGEVTGRVDGSAGLSSPRAGAGRTSGARNHHPTVKSVALMRYLVRLVTPPGGVVLDPFAGSGSTGLAAMLEGAAFFGAELDVEYLEVAALRIAAWERYR